MDDLQAIDVCIRRLREACARLARLAVAARRTCIRRQTPNGVRRPNHVGRRSGKQPDSTGRVTQGRCDHRGERRARGIDVSPAPVQVPLDRTSPPATSSNINSQAHRPVATAAASVGNCISTPRTILSWYIEGYSFDVTLPRWRFWATEVCRHMQCLHVSGVAIDRLQYG